MKNALIDAGPIIALFDKDDKYHLSVVKFLEIFKGRLFTTWPVITEAAYMLNFNVDVQIDFLEWIKREAVIIIPIETIHLERISELIKKYSDVPMDLADSSLVATAEYTGIENILSIDKDFYIYKTKSKKFLTNLLSGHIKI